MAIDKLPSGAFRARLTVDGIRYAETFPTRPEAQDWETVTRAKAVTGSLPTHVTVEEYAARWIRTYDAKPVNTRIFHTRNLRTVTAALGSSQVAKVVPTDITVMLNRVMETMGAAYAARVYRTTSADRVEQLDRWLHHYNHHRFHHAVGGPPITRVNNVPACDN